MGKLFGTDGVRGIPGKYPLVPDAVRRLGRVAADVLRRREAKARPHRNGTAPIVLLGRDSRKSGVPLGRYLAEGISKAGCAVSDAGVIPTPALAYLVPHRNALCGVMISASHNPAEFNGIKFLNGDGFKMPPEVEEEIEARLACEVQPARGPAKLLHDPHAAVEYADFLRSSLPANLDLTSLKVVVDCANGAASKIAPDLFRRLGAEVAPIGCSPDGSNINDGCGALETGAMRREVVRRNFDCGVSLDGDADRAIFSDHAGGLCDGDVLISMAAIDLKERGLLKGDAVVLTVMSNFGLIRFLKEQGIRVILVPVGDRNVTDAIEREGLSLGGEASGHIVFREFSTTGDGMLTALQILSILARSKRRLRFFRRRYRIYPQILKNLRVETKVPLEEMPEMQRRIRSCERRLKGKGRVFVRYSGTEPLIRVLMEGPDLSVLRHMSEALIETFKKEMSALQSCKGD